MHLDVIVLLVSPMGMVNANSTVKKLALADNILDDRIYANEFAYPVSGSRLSKTTDPRSIEPRPCGDGGKLFTVVQLLPLALGLSLLFTLPALIVLTHFYINEQAKLNLIENLHRNLSATLNTTDLIAGVEDLLGKHEAFLIRQKTHDDSSGCRVCPDGWNRHSGKCYYFSSNGKNWKESRDNCNSLGGHLVIVNNQQEQTFLISKASGQVHWIGLSDLETEGQWIWVDSTPLKPGTEFWLKRPDGQNEPDNWKEEDATGEHCACISREGEWHDNSCRKSHRYVCEALAPQ